MQCFINKCDGLISLEIFFGLKKGTKAPHFSEIFFIFNEFVETTTSLKKLHFKAALIVQ